MKKKEVIAFLSVFALDVLVSIILNRYVSYKFQKIKDSLAMENLMDLYLFKFMTLGLIGYLSPILLFLILKIGLKSSYKSSIIYSLVLAGMSLLFHRLTF